MKTEGHIYGKYGKSDGRNRVGGAAMNYKKRIAELLLVTCLIVESASFTAWAATKAITSVTVRVGTDIEAGEYLDDGITLYTDSTDAQDGTYAATNSAKYYVADAEWITSSRNAVSVGDEPKMRLYIDIEDSDYAFKGSYSSSNVTVKGGTFVSAKKDSAGQLEVTVKLQGIKGTYNPPGEAGWRDSGYGKAYWKVDEDEETSGYYDVYLYRGSTAVKKLEAYKGTSYNFYPYMTKAGTYSFKVRTVPYTETQKKYGKKSDWTESDEIYLDAQHVSDGTGQTDDTGLTVGSTAQVGWINSDGYWYYRYPDGVYQKDSWLLLNGKWYLFDQNGRMLTGWQTKNGHTYYMLDSGEMYIGWIKAGDYWYFLNRATDGIEGAVHTGWLVNNDKTYYMNSSGAMVEGWQKIDDNWYYFYPGSGNKAVNTVIDTFYVDNDGIWRR